jgi:hypothetical protein
LSTALRLRWISWWRKKLLLSRHRFPIALCWALLLCTPHGSIQRIDISDSVEGGSGSIVSSQGVAATPSKLHGLTRGHEAMAG